MEVLIIVAILIIGGIILWKITKLIFRLLIIGAIVFAIYYFIKKDQLLDDTATKWWKDFSEKVERKRDSN